MRLPPTPHEPHDPQRLMGHRHQRLLTALPQRIPLVKGSDPRIVSACVPRCIHQHPPHQRIPLLRDSPTVHRIAGWVDAWRQSRPRVPAYHRLMTHPAHLQNIHLIAVFERKPYTTTEDGYLETEEKRITMSFR
jgi:hypothetical protein